MLFHTWPFLLLFFLVVYALYLALSKTRYWLHWLLAASYFFYGWWNPLYLLLIAYSTLLDNVPIARMDRSGRKMLWLSSLGSSRGSTSRSFLGSCGDGLAQPPAFRIHYGPNFLTLNHNLNHLHTEL